MFSWQWESFEEIIKSYAPVVIRSTASRPR
jgi:hypothetical protein